MVIANNDAEVAAISKHRDRLGARVFLPSYETINEAMLKQHYLRHNDDVIKYFRFRDDLLVINLKEAASYQRFCAFLKVEPVYEEFPWLNRSG